MTMTFETVNDEMEELTHLYYILEELHHISSYDLEKVRLEYCDQLETLLKHLKELTNEKWYNRQYLNDEAIVNGDVE